MFGGCALENLKNAPMTGKTFFQVASELFEKLEIGEMELMATMARWIWLRRNTVVFDTMFQHLNHTVITVRETLRVSMRQNNKLLIRSFDS